MNKSFLLIIAIIFFSLNGWTQQASNLPFGSRNLKMAPVWKLEPSLDMTGGYLFETENDIYKVNLSANNIFYNAFGLYTSFEWGVDDLGEDYFSNMIGATASVLPKLYIFGGFDFFTEHGMFSNDPVNPIFCRKELGIGYTPLRWIAFRGSWSNSMGFTASAGLRIPL